MIKARLGLMAGMWCAGLLAAQADNVRHRFVCIDNAKDARLIYVDPFTPSNSWTRPVSAASRSLQRLDGGRILVGFDTGFAEYALNGGDEVARLAGYERISSVARMPDGSTWLAGHSPSGVVVHVVERDLRARGAPRLVYPDASALRLLQVLENGHLLMAVNKPFRAVELDEAGRTVWSAALEAYGDKGYEVCRLPDGTTLASTGGGVKVVQVDRQGRLLHFWGEQKRGDHPEWGLDFVSGFDRLTNGNIVVSNWLGHGKHGTGPHLVEFNADNVPVWQWADPAAGRQVTHVLMIE